MYPSVTDMACIPSIFIKTVHENLGESWHQPSFSDIVANLLRIIEICHRGCWKWSFIFWMSLHSQKHMLPKAMIRWKKNLIFKIIHEKKNQKVLMKIDEMEDIFLNLANLAQHTFFTLMRPCRLAAILKT